MNTPSDRKEREWHWEDTKEPMKKSTSAMGDGWAQSTMEALTDGAALRQEISEDITKAFGSAIQGTVLDSDSPKAGSINQAEISNDKMEQGAPKTRGGGEYTELNTSVL